MFISSSRVLLVPQYLTSLHFTRFGNYGRIEVSDFYGFVVPVMFATAMELDEIHWDDRLHHENHGTGLFAQRFTAFVDCGGLKVQRPKDPVVESALFDGKTGSGHVWKMQIGINFLGWIVMYTGLHISKVRHTYRHIHRNTHVCSHMLRIKTISSGMKRGTSTPWNRGNGGLLTAFTRLATRFRRSTPGKMAAYSVTSRFTSTGSARIFSLMLSL